METGIDVKKVREELDQEDWEEDSDNPGQQMRRVYLGSWCSLSPSGKIYMPWANSNVQGCDGCNGTGHPKKSRLKRRVLKKRNSRQKIRGLWVKRYGNEPWKWPKHIMAKSKRLNSLNRENMISCPRCGGLGSREAHLDELWVKAVTEELAEEGICYDPDGDDLFASEYRDAEDAEDEEEDEEDAENPEDSLDVPVESPVESADE